MTPLHIACLLILAPCSVAFAATPLDDTDLGHVHIGGGNVLSTSGAPSPGPDTAAASRGQADPDTFQVTDRQTDRIFRDDSQPVVHGRVEMNRRNGDTQIVFQSQDQYVEVVPTGNALSSGVRLINGNRIDSILVRDAGGSGAHRGDFGLQDLSINHTIRISPGQAR